MGITRSFSKALPDLFQTPAILAQIRISQSGGGANLDQLLLSIQQKFSVIDKQKSMELNPQIAWTFFDNGGISPTIKYLL